MRSNEELFFSRIFMKYNWAPFVIGTIAMILGSCQSNDSFHQIISQKYVHKYGFDLSEEDWQKRAQEGQVVSKLKNGVTIARSYENGNLHGPTTYTFPHNKVIEKCLVYDQGTLLKETLYDTAGMPLREEVYEFDDRLILTLWNDKGVPLSIEEYDGDLLLNGKYFSADHEIEAQIEN